jgi:hypothetical protein
MEKRCLGLQKALDNPEFEAWNTSSFHHVILTIYGLDGEKAHYLGIQLAEKFYTWFMGPFGRGFWQYVTKYHPRNGLVPFPHSTELRKMIDDAVTFYNEHKGNTPEEIRHYLSTGKYKSDEEDDDDELINGEIGNQE